MRRLALRVGLTSLLLHDCRRSSGTTSALIHGGTPRSVAGSASSCSNVAVVSSPNSSSASTMTTTTQRQPARVQQQPVGRGTLFRFLLVPLHPTVDTVLLQKNYHRLQRRMHPDNVTAATAISNGEGPLAFSVDDSAYANIAYETLREPFLRCQYLLKYLAARAAAKRPLTLLEEEHLAELDNSRESLGRATHNRSAGSSASLPSSSNTGDDALSPELLERYMGYNEVVFSYDAEDPTSNDEEKEQFARVAAQVDTEDAQYEAAVNELWAKSIRERSEPPDVKDLRPIIMRWTYIYNLKKHIRQRKAIR